jgi:hypothetical protein
MTYTARALNLTPRRPGDLLWCIKTKSRNHNQKCAQQEEASDDPFPIAFHCQAWRFGLRPADGERELGAATAWRRSAGESSRRIFPNRDTG